MRVRVPKSYVEVNPIININEIQLKWLKCGFSCDLWVDAPETRWEDFTHEMDERVMLVQGKVEFEIAGKIFHPIIGEELLIPAKALHSVRNIGTMESRWLYGYASLISD